MAMSENTNIESESDSHLREFQISECNQESEVATNESLKGILLSCREESLKTNDEQMNGHTVVILEGAVDDIEVPISYQVTKILADEQKAFKDDNGMLNLLEHSNESSQFKILYDFEGIIIEEKMDDRCTDYAGTTDGIIANEMSNINSTFEEVDDKGGKEEFNTNALENASEQNRKKWNGQRRTLPKERCNHIALVNYTGKSFWCGLLSEKDRENVFRIFWKLETWDEKKSFVYCLVKTRQILKRRKETKRINNHFKKTEGHDYFLPTCTGKMLKVCHRMFVNSLSIGELTLKRWLKEEKKVLGCETLLSKFLGSECNQESEVVTSQPPSCRKEAVETSDDQLNGANLNGTDFGEINYQVITNLGDEQGPFNEDNGIFTLLEQSSDIGQVSIYYEFDNIIEEINADGSVDSASNTDGIMASEISSINSTFKEVVDIGENEESNMNALEKASEQNRKQWNRKSRALAKITRLTGKIYEGYKRGKENTIMRTLREAKKVKKRCNHKTQEIYTGKSYLCGLLSEKDRENVFGKFWNLGTWDEKKSFVRSLARTRPILRRRRETKNVNNHFKKTEGHDYFLPTCTGKKLKVCHRMFVSSLSLGEDSLKRWLKEEESTSESSDE